MGSIFISVFDFFCRRKKTLWALLAVMVAVMAYFAVQVRFNEDITSFFPDDKDGKKNSLVFKNLKIKDKIVVLFSSESETPDPDMLIETGDKFVGNLQQAIDEGYIESVISTVDAGTIKSTTGFIYENLPLYLTPQDYARLDSLTGPEAIEAAVLQCYRAITSPMGMAVQHIVMKDPLGIGTHLLNNLQQFNTNVNHELYDDHIFSKDLSVMLIIINPAQSANGNARNDKLVSLIEDNIKTISKPASVEISYFGAPAMAAYNARQIKKDTMITLSAALLVVIIVITLAFRNKWSFVLMIVPVVFGGLFSLSVIYLISGNMSAIAIGAGAAVFGIALSYSIHVLSHSNHVHDPRQLIKELAWPLTVGSFTTIGAFSGLLFTRSELLRDFGLFSALTLAGTTIFCLVFLPHLLFVSKNNKPGRILSFIEGMNSYPFDKNRLLTGGIVLIAVICMFFYNDVKFDSDIRNLGFEPEHIKKAEARLLEFIGRENGNVYIISASSDTDQAITTYTDVENELTLLQEEGRINNFTSAQQFIVPRSIQRERLERWNNFWTSEKREHVSSGINEAAIKTGFNPGAFDGFASLIDKNYELYDFGSKEVRLIPLFSEWINHSDSLTLLVSRISVDPDDKNIVYGKFEQDENIAIVDRAYFSSKMADVISDDFNRILYISSFLIFAALLISYGRIELAAMAFIPMLISWIIILGLMTLFGIEFNIVNIILATFIFGIGDDFSIFIMDGLLCEYRDGKKILASHKTAIFFSAFTTIAGIGALIFARHPALKSISLISILGILAVVLVSYTIQPVIFRAFISTQTKKGGFPYTLLGILNTIYAFGYFLFGCLLLQICILALLPLPVTRKKKKLLFHKLISWFTYTFLRTMITTRLVMINQHHETFQKPAVIVANHQSFIDILLLLSMNPKLVMVTNSWVWKSPFFGRIVRYAGFFHTAEGYETLAGVLREKLNDGYSVVIFPEGTRSADCKIKRFHKGAFYLAELLKTDILPVVIYGTGMVSSKKQGFYIKKGFITGKILKRIHPSDGSFGDTYQQRTKEINKYFKDEYDILALEYDRANNNFFRDALIKNYIYKGPVLEWYTRVKVKLEGYYDYFDRLVPRNASIVDMGCGYGHLCRMLALLSDKRHILGIDYDADKINLAGNCFSANSNILFACADALEYPLQKTDVFIINDMLHYLAAESQEQLMERCLENMTDTGMLIIRDGDITKQKRHRLTQKTEEWSTEIIRFNKTTGPLHFISSEKMEQFALKHNLNIEIRDNDKHTSNTIFIFRKN